MIAAVFQLLLTAECKFFKRILPAAGRFFAAAEGFDFFQLIQRQIAKINIHGLRDPQQNTVVHIFARIAERKGNDNAGAQSFFSGKDSTFHGTAVQSDVTAVAIGIHHAQIAGVDVETGKIIRYVAQGLKSGQYSEINLIRRKFLPQLIGPEFAHLTALFGGKRSGRQTVIAIKFADAEFNHRQFMLFGDDAGAGFFRRISHQYYRVGVFKDLAVVEKFFGIAAAAGKKNSHIGAAFTGQLPQKNMSVKFVVVISLRKHKIYLSIRHLYKMPSKVQNCKS